MLIYTHCWELMYSVGSHGSSSLTFVMKVMVCHFVSDSHEVMTALQCRVTFNCCCGDFSATSSIFCSSWLFWRIRSSYEWNVMELIFFRIF
jgi:hypothetical protein